MKKPNLYHIRIQRRLSRNGGAGWHTYREYLVWPKTFPSYKEADDFMKICFTFKGITGRKLSATVERCR